MSRQNVHLTEKEIVRAQFLNLHSLQSTIQKLNHINVYREKGSTIGDKSDKIRFHSYAETFDKMMYDSRYTILLDDDSMVFMFYEFDEQENIIGHVLSYLPNFRDVEEYYEGFWEESDTESIEEVNLRYIVTVDEKKYLIRLHDKLSNFVRVDYEVDGNAEYYHSLIHMHVGTERNAIRIPVEHCVMPYEFLYFVLKYVYRLDDDELCELEFDCTRTSMLTKNEKRKLKLAFSDCVL